VLQIAGSTDSGAPDLSAGGGRVPAVGLDALSLLPVMACITIVVFRKLGAAVSRRSWINFDLIWAAALLIVGGISMYHASA
jgi:hypothetical protein